MLQVASREEEEAASEAVFLAWLGQRQCHVAVPTKPCSRGHAHMAVPTWLCPGS